MSILKVGQSLELLHIILIYFKNICLLFLIHFILCLYSDLSLNLILIFISILIYNSHVNH